MSQARAYAQLLRLPALPTALADIGLGALATAALPERWATFGLLLVASGCLYLGGMVWNDFFDVEQDRRERPERPIPSGRVPRRSAGRLGTALLIVGVLTALAADLGRPEDGQSRPYLSVTIAAGIALSVLLYDGMLKATVLGPVALGLCRFLNVLLGLSISGGLAGPLGLHLAGVVGLYAAGITWLARTEARTSRPAILLGAAVVLGVALAAALPLPLHGAPGQSSVLFPYLLVLLGLAIGPAVARALRRPNPPQVQAAVRRCLLGLIVLDTALATAVAGSGGLLLLVLLVPALYLATRRHLDAT